MDRFAKFHPVVSFSFFMAVIVLTVIFSNPIYHFISLVGAFLYLLKLKGKEVFNTLFKFIIPLIIFVGVFNMIFCHYGDTVLFSVKEIKFTLECLLYGFSNGLMLSAVILWFSSYNEVITSDKFMALFGKFSPNLALLFCMILRFIPLMEKTSKEIKDSQIGIGNETKGLKNTISRFSSLISISLEKSIETADSMKSRGFGTKKRSHYSRYYFKFKDAFMLAIVLALFIFLIVSKLLGFYDFSFNPMIKIISYNYISLVISVLLFLIPLMVDIMEDIKWHYLKSKI